MRGGAGRDKVERNRIARGETKGESAKTKPKTVKKAKQYVIVRTTSAGVFAGYIDSRKGREVVLSQARRIWYWDGAASLSQLAMTGTSKPQTCKFPQEVDRVVLTEAIEILDVTQEAKASIASVPVWRQ